jgi:hypothetical protein
MFRCVVLGRFVSVVLRIQMVTMRYMSVMTSFFVIARLIVFRGGPMVPGGVLMMICGVAMMFGILC